MTDVRDAVGDLIKELAAECDDAHCWLIVALESLDKIGAMTKRGRASLMARAAAIFIRTQLESAQRLPRLCCVDAARDCNGDCLTQREGDV